MDGVGGERREGDGGECCRACWACWGALRPCAAPAGRAAALSLNMHRVLWTPEPCPQGVQDAFTDWLPKLRDGVLVRAAGRAEQQGACRGRGRRVRGPGRRSLLRPHPALHRLPPGGHRHRRAGAALRGGRGRLRVQAGGRVCALRVSVVLLLLLLWLAARGTGACAVAAHVSRRPRVAAAAAPRACAAPPTPDANTAHPPTLPPALPRCAALGWPGARAATRRCARSLTAASC